MKNKEQHTDSEFLSEETLRQYKEGKLSPSEMRRVERLLEKYPLYADALEGLTLLAEDKAQENISFLKQYAESQALAKPTARIVPLHKNNFMRAIAASVVLLVAFIGLYYTFTYQNKTAETVGQVAFNNDSSAPPRGSANGVTPPQSEEAEAANKQSLAKEEQPTTTENSGKSSQPKQEALADIKNSDELKKDMKKELEIGKTITDSVNVLAKRDKELRASDAEITEAIETESNTNKERRAEEKPSIVVTPAPITTENQANKGEVSDKDDLDRSAAKEERKQEDRKRLSNAKKKQEVAEEKNYSPNSAASTNLGSTVSPDETLKNTLKQQLTDLAKTQKETLKGTFLAKVIFTKSGKVRKVSIQKMPCATCPTERLIKTIEEHQFANAKEEKLIEIVF